MERTMRHLTDAQQRFVAAYLRCGRAVAAARQAGYSPATATHSSGRLMRAPHIRAAIAEGRARQERSGAPLRDRVVRELERIAFGSPDEESLRPMDRLRALDLLGRMAERDLRRAKDSATAPAEETAPPRAPAWEEQARRGMERVERGRRKDEERARREEEAKEAAKEAEQAETTVSFVETATDRPEHDTPEEANGTENNETGERVGESAVTEEKIATVKRTEEKTAREEPDWMERRAYFRRCYPLTHWPEEAAFYERMGRFDPT